MSSAKFTPTFVFLQTNSGLEAVAIGFGLVLFLARIGSYWISSNKGRGEDVMESVGGSFMQKKEWAELPEVLGRATHVPAEHRLPF